MIIEKEVSLQPYTTFMTEAHTRFFCSIKSKDDIVELLNSEEWKNYPHYFLGSGSNTLVVDDFPGLMVQIALLGTETIHENQEEIHVKVAAGEPWHPFVLKMAEAGYWGIENLALIPGLVGAVPVQNIGAYGVEAQDTILWVETINTATGETKLFHNAECEFAYRSSIFKHKAPEYLVTAVAFRLSKKALPKLEYGALRGLLDSPESLSPLRIAQEVMSIRRSKLPEVGEIGMAGSFFKNPIISNKEAARLKERFPELPVYDEGLDMKKVSAAWLIDYLGYKGVRLGEVGTYHKHALVLVNYGDATGSEVWDFAQKIMTEVNETFGIFLEPEVIILGAPETASLK